jgi:hypothetical protein
MTSTGAGCFANLPTNGEFVLAHRAES